MINSIVDKSIVDKSIKEILGLTKSSKDLSEPDFIDETWVWVEGFKGTDENMQGHGKYQFEVGKRYDMPEDVKIIECNAGFHLSLNMGDVFKHYSIGSGKRFFKVRALVRKSDLEGYGKQTGHCFGIPIYRDKLASKSIEFIEELSVDEIFQATEHADWSVEKKNLAIAKGVYYVEQDIEVDELVELGYSRPFASYIVHNKGEAARAKAVGSQPDLSMDMKALMILEW